MGGIDLSSTINICLKDYLTISNCDWDFPNNQQDALSSLHPYPAKFVNSLPRTLIDKLGCPTGAYVFDPFCGSGTTLVEAQRAGIESIGIDLNPIACLISRVKTMPLHNSFLDVYQEIILNAKNAYSERRLKIPKIPNLDHWFSPDIQKAITAISHEICKVEDEHLRDALSFCLSSIIVRVSNQESDTRYAAIEKSSAGKDVFSFFTNSCNRLYMAKSNEKCLPQSKIINNDILQIMPTDIGNNIGLVITSPPYPNAYEYWLYHKYRMWWLGYDPIKVRSLEIGARPHYQKKNGQTEEDFAMQMKSVFSLLNKCLIRNGHICFVIGRSIIKGKHINNSTIIESIADNLGLIQVADIEREILSNKKSFNPSYGKISKENILVFRKE